MEYHTLYSYYAPAVLVREKEASQEKFVMHGYITRIAVSEPEPTFFAYRRDCHDRGQHETLDLGVLGP